MLLELRSERKSDVDKMNNMETKLRDLHSANINIKNQKVLPPLHYLYHNSSQCALGWIVVHLINFIN